MHTHDPKNISLSKKQEFVASDFIDTLQETFALPNKKLIIETFV
jgi:hypothetical protein